jgi:hypothetical protein
VLPALAALARIAIRELARNRVPRRRPVFIDEAAELGVLFREKFVPPALQGLGHSKTN